MELFKELDVKIVKSNMTFGASFGGGKLEYGLASLNSLFAQRRNVFKPKFIRMLKDITRFNALAESLSEDPGMTIDQLLIKIGTSSWFKEYYLFPLTGAIWSMPAEQMTNFPAKSLINFMKNHALLSVSGQHQWLTLEGGSISYVEKLAEKMRFRNVEIRLGCPIRCVQRLAGSVKIETGAGLFEDFEEVVFATHADDTLGLLVDASPDESEALGAIRYQPNEAVLHADKSLMPRSKLAWSSWVYHENEDNSSSKIELTYWMNSLQPIPMNDPLFVTLNSGRLIKEELIYDTVTFRHPVYDLKTLSAQEKIKALNGHNQTWFCGAWIKNGFHEDGYSSAIDVAKSILSNSKKVLLT
jgi:predicted NAD/FAD-binding protein